MTTSPRPSARGGIQARKINAQERLEGSLYERQALTDHGEIRARVLSEAVNCAICGQLVHPDNFTAHMFDKHPSLTSGEKALLIECENVIEQGLNTFYEVGERLLTVRDSVLYREEYRTFENYCQTQWNMTRRNADRLIEASEVADNLRPMGLIPANERQARELTTLEPDEQRLAWEVVQQTAPNGKITAAHVKSVASVLKEVAKTEAIDDGSGEQIRVADVFKAAVLEETYERMKRQESYIAEKTSRKAQILHSSESNEWYTPAQYIESARLVMGDIDLDPASCEVANEIIKAGSIYTVQDSGIGKRWFGRVWLNPPYGRDNGESNQATWSKYLLHQYGAGYIEQAILLVNATTDRAWFQPLWQFPICFTDHRIKFENSNGDSDNPTHGNAFVYLGDNREKFIEEFSKHGAVVTQVVRRIV